MPTLWCDPNNQCYDIGNLCRKF